MALALFEPLPDADPQLTPVAMHVHFREHDGQGPKTVGAVKYYKVVKVTEHTYTDDRDRMLGFDTTPFEFERADDMDDYVGRERAIAEICRMVKASSWSGSWDQPILFSAFQRSRYRSSGCLFFFFFGFAVEQVIN